MNQSQSTTAALWRLPTVCDFCGLSKSEIYRRVRAGEFVAPVKLGRRSVAWPAEAVKAWVAERIKGGAKGGV